MKTQRDKLFSNPEKREEKCQPHGSGRIDPIRNFPEQKSSLALFLQLESLVHFSSRLLLVPRKPRESLSLLFPLAIGTQYVSV